MKSEKVWKVLVITVVMLMVASVAGAVNLTDDSADIMERKVLDDAPSDDAHFSLCYTHPKMSAGVAKSIPPPGIAPPTQPMIVNIYLTENKTEYIKELRNHTIEITSIKANRVVAEIYTSEILAIVNLPFVTYMETPLIDFPETSSYGEVSVFNTGSVGRHPKMSAGIASSIPPPGVAPPAKPVVVNIYLTENRTEYIEELGDHIIEQMSIKGNRVAAEIYTSEILDIVNLPFVTYVETPLMDFLETFSDPIISEGVKCLNADVLHNLNITGKGVKIAIIDHGFYRYNESTELPESVKVKSFRGDNDTRVDNPGYRHGTACAEIVHDVAPDAELYLINYGRIDELENAVKWLINKKVDIITRSAGYLAGLFDGSDEICEIIDEAVFNHGIIWVNSAGNYAQRHWEGLFNDTDGDGWHEFHGNELGQTIYANSGKVVILVLSWNDTWNRPTQDYNMAVFFRDESDSSLKEVDYIWPGIPRNPQMGSPDQHPYEICAFKAPSDGIYYIAIQNYDATKPVHFELYSPDYDLGCVEKNSSLNAESTALGAIAVGAVNWKTLKPEYYSSRGPTNDGRIKPDFVGPARVSTDSYGGGGFWGTSAAAPHVAGALALQLSCIKKSQPGQKDNQYGHGLPMFCNCSGMD